VRNSEGDREIALSKEEMCP